MKNKLLSFLLFAGIISLGNMSFSQTQIDTTVIDQGTTNDNYVPIYGYYNYSYSQMIYLSSDMNPAVQGQPSVIDKIAFYNVTGNVNSAQDWTIVMANTSKTVFSGSTDWVTGSDVQTVFQGVVTANGANNWMTITLNTPFVYDGTSNLMIGVLQTTSGYSQITWGAVATSSNRSHVFHSDYTMPNIASPQSSYTYRTNIPKIKIEHIINKCEDTTFAASYPISIVSDTICENEMVSASFDSLNTTMGLTYQWQYDSLGTWIDLPNDTLRNFTGYLPFNTDLHIKVSCPANGTSVLSGDSTITISPIPNVSINFNDVAYCDGGSVALIASGADSYSWSPTTNLSNPALAVVNANPSSATNYIVTGTTSNGCVNTDTVTVRPISDVQTNIDVDQSTLCSAPVTINGTINGATYELANGANWEYLVLGSDSSIISNWTSQNTFSLSAPIDSVYGVMVAIRSSDCPTAADTSSIQNITVGFGADADVQAYNCNNLGGSISMINDFGQSSTNEIFSNSFADASNLTDVTIHGDASVTNGRLVLTPSATSQSGWANITPSGQMAFADNNLNVKFDLSIDQLVTGFGLPGADGFAYSFGSDAGNSSSNWQNGSGSGLRISFDDAENSPNLVGIYLVYGKTNTNAPTPNEATTIAYSGDTSSWFGETDVPVEINIESGKLTLTVNGQVIFNNIAMPAAYLSANIGNWVHSFSALTGGAGERAAIKNVQISSGSYQFGISQTANEPTDWQTGKLFDSLAPGTYNVWMRRDSVSACKSMVKTITILNTNPVVDLGGDYTICDGDSVVLDAGNPGAVYLWSGSNNTNQELTVTQSGTYVVQVTATDGCQGIGSSTVTVNSAPNLDANNLSVNVLSNSVILTVLNTEPNYNYNWDLGDGTQINNGPASISHIYNTSQDTYNVTVYVSNDCGIDSITKTIDLTTSGVISEADGKISIYPNPSKNYFTIDLGNETASKVLITDVNGRVVANFEAFKNTKQVDVSAWEKGVYFVNVYNTFNTRILKIVVE